MAITSGFYNSSNGDRKYTAEQFNSYFEGLVSGGVFENVGGALRVVASSGMQVQVSTGRLADTKGRWMKNDAVMNLTVSAADVTLPRYDAIVVKIDSSQSVRAASIYVKQGTAASSPTKPTVTRDTSVEEYCLAYVYVAAGATSITQSSITDTRYNRSVCGIVVGLIEQLNMDDAFDQYDTAFWEWFSTVKETLATSTLIRSYNSAYTTTKTSETVIPININQYNKELDILQVYINGLKLVPGTEYTITSNAQITLIKDVDAGTSISFEVFKSVDGSNAETIVSQVNDIQTQMDKYQYVGSGANDNVLLSQIVQSFLNGGDDYAQLEIDVIGSLTCSEPYSGDGSTSRPYLWFALGQSSSTSRRIRFNFAKCDRITVDSNGYSNVVLFGGNDIYMRNCRAVINNAATGKIFNGERVVCDDSEFWLNGSNTLIGGGCCGTFTNCRMSVTSSDGAASGFSANGNILRLINCEILAYNASSASDEANAVLVEANKTENVLIMNGCNIPVISRSGYKQTNTVKINNGYYNLNGNILGKAAAKYSTGDGKTETGTMIISK